MRGVSRSIDARVQAQSSTRQGGHHWLLERLTSVALVPLTLWFVVAAESHAAAKAALERIEQITGLTVHAFPKEREYFVGLRLTAQE